MKELSLDEIKQVELEILKEFHSFCLKNNIRYFLSHGTLLGAVRYGGFIPWDDDVDVLVPREDYDRLIQTFRDTQRYRLFAYEKDKSYRYPYAKLCDMTTCKVETGYDNGVVLGLDIDVFPLDHWDDDLEKAKGESRRQRRNMFRLGLSKLQKSDSVHPAKRFVKGIFMALCKLRGSACYVEKLMDCACKPEQKGSCYLGSKVWNIYGEREILPADIFAETVELEFEGEEYPAPVGYDAFLRSLYGDYLPEPPVEQRRTHHSFKAYRKNAREDGS